MMVIDHSSVCDSHVQNFNHDPILKEQKKENWLEGKAQNVIVTELDIHLNENYQIIQNMNKTFAPYMQEGSFSFLNNLWGRSWEDNQSELLGLLSGDF